MNKKRLVFISGSGVSEKMWQPQVEYFSRDFDIIIPDIHPYDNVEIMAQAVLHATEHADCLIGLSLGGIVAQYVLRLKPDFTNHLILMATWARSPRQEIKDFCVASLDNLTSNRVTLETAAKEISMNETQHCPTLQPIAEQAILEVGKTDFISDGVAFMNAPDLSNDLETIQAKTLVIFGDSDMTADLNEQEFIASKIPHARLIVLKNCTHLMTLDQPDQVNQLIEQWITI